MPKIETFNACAVGTRGNWIVMIKPPRGPMTHEEALGLAAWLVALADGPALNDEGETLEGSARTRFDQVLEAIQNT